MKKIILFSLTFVLLFTFTSCNKNKKLHEYEDGYFKYVIRNKEVYITGFTEEGKQVKYMEFPETIDNKEVVGIGYKYKGKYYNDFEYSNILKIYVNEKTHKIFEGYDEYYVYKSMCYVSMVYNGISTIDSNRDYTFGVNDVFLIIYILKIIRMRLKLI